METPKKVVLIGDKDHPIVAPSTPDTVASTPSPQRNRNLYHHSSPISPQTNARRQLGGVGGKGRSSPMPDSLPCHQTILPPPTSYSKVKRFVMVLMVAVSHTNIVPWPPMQHRKSCRCVDHLTLLAPKRELPA